MRRISWLSGRDGVKTHYAKLKQTVGHGVNCGATSAARAFVFYQPTSTFAVLLNASYKTEGRIKHCVLIGSVAHTCGLAHNSRSPVPQAVEFTAPVVQVVSLDHEGANILSVCVTLVDRFRALEIH